MRDIATALLTIVGSGFILLAAVGILRMPDLFTRMQTATKAATLGAGTLLLAVAVHFGETATTAKSLVIIAFLFLTAPVAAHIIAKAAYSVGIELWDRSITDELKQARRPK